MNKIITITLMALFATVLSSNAKVKSASIEQSIVRSKGLLKTKGEITAVSTKKVGKETYTYVTIKSLQYGTFQALVTKMNPRKAKSLKGKKGVMHLKLKRFPHYSSKADLVNITK